jgi:hypothetical protein
MLQDFIIPVNQTERRQASGHGIFLKINPLTPNDPYIGRTAPITSKRCTLYIYSRNIGTDFFKHGIYSPFLSVQNTFFFL